MKHTTAHAHGWLGLGIMAALLTAGCDGGDPDGEPTPALARTCVRERLALPAQTVAERLVETYDDAGHALTAALTTEDHTWDATATRTYDAAGRLVREDVSDAGSLGGPFARAYTYDAAGRLLTMTLTGDVTEFWARSLTLQYAGDDAVAPQRVAIVTGYETVVDTYARDAVGRVTTRLRETSGVSYGPAPVLERETFGYDTAGRLVSVTIDRGADDTIDQLHLIERDAAGRVVSSGLYDPDETWIEGTLVTRDGTRVSQLRWDSTLDGVERVDYTYDAAGEVATATLAYGEDGPATARTTLTGGRPGASCAGWPTEASRAPVDRFYADPASPWLYGTPGLERAW